MVACRVVDNAAVALAAINRAPVAAARAQALAHPREGGATLFGLGSRVRVHAQWAAWANAVAVRELDFHDTFLAREFGHPGDSIAPLVAVAQQCGRGGEALLRRIDDSAAAKLLTAARWYKETGNPVSAELTIRRLLQRYPRTSAAREALELIPSILARLPESVLNDLELFLFGLSEEPALEDAKND